MLWMRPCKLRELMDQNGGFDPDTLPERSGLYVFSSTPWDRKPTNLLYLGSGHATASTNLRHRVGNEVASALGFHGVVAGAGHGGVLLSKYCRENNISPLDLYLGWRTLPNNVCPVPDEQQLYDCHHNKLSPHLLNKKRPSSCGITKCEKHKLR